MFGLVVEGEAVDADLGELFDVVAGVGDVEVAVEMGVGEVSAEPLDDWRPDGQVRHKVAESLRSYPSMMSMWRESAPRSMTSWHSFARSPKSAERMEGPTNTLLFLSLII